MCRIVVFFLDTFIFILYFFFCVWNFFLENLRFFWTKILHGKCYILEATKTRSCTRSKWIQMSESTFFFAKFYLDHLIKDMFFINFAKFTSSLTLSLTIKVRHFQYIPLYIRNLAKNVKELKDQNGQIYLLVPQELISD